MVLAQSRIFSQIAPKNYAVFWRNLGFCPNSFFHLSRNKLYFCRLLIPYKMQNDGNKRKKTEEIQPSERFVEETKP